MTGSISRVGLHRRTSSEHSIRGIHLKDADEIGSEVWHDKILPGWVSQDRVWVGFILSFRNRAGRRQDKFLFLDNFGAGSQRKLVRRKCRKVTVMDCQREALNY